VAVIVVYGATGFTGRLVAAELVAQGLPVVVAGRDPRAVRVLGESLGVASAVASADEPRSLRAIFDDATVVVSCAGPFASVGRPVAMAAVESGAHYVDISGEPAFLWWAYRELDGPARRAGVAAVPAAGFDYVPADAAASLLLRRLGPLRRLDYVYSSESSGSSGTRRTAIGVLRDGGFVVRRGHPVPTRPGGRSRRVSFSDGARDALMVPLGDPLCAQRRFGVEDATSWVVAGRGLGRAIRLGSPLLRVSGVRLAAERVIAGNRGGGPTLEQRLRSRFAIRVEGLGRLRGHGVVELRGVDSYGVTARALALRVRSLLGGIRRPGVLTPAEERDAPRTQHELRIDIRES
jgi:short subunit dehydrogenase-like uncharacterized protein